MNYFKMSVCIYSGMVDCDEPHRHEYAFSAECMHCPKCQKIMTAIRYRDLHSKYCGSKNFELKNKNIECVFYIYRSYADGHTELWAGNPQSGFKSYDQAEYIVKGLTVWDFDQKGYVIKEDC